ncbi:hypothetical protein AAKU55_001895 [Oxalobacteraceae bacterium GrIS 1.11]
MSTRISTLLAGAALCATATTASAGLLFNLNYDPSLVAFGANLANLESATQYVANEFSALYNNNVTLNINVTRDPANGLGASLFEDNGSSYTYAQVRAALISHASTPASISATTLLPLLDPSGGGNFVIANAQAKALGLLAANAPGLDGTFFIGAGNSYAFNPGQRALVGAYDYLGTAEHEFSEIMGRVTQLTNPGFGFMPFDLFRCSAGAVNLNPAASNVYFSTDGCITNAHSYNASGNGGDIQDWAGSIPADSFDAFGNTNEAEPMSAIDQVVMNTLGWQAAAQAVPAPSSLALLWPGMLLLFWRRPHPCLLRERCATNAV